jgi:hypothetical protein
MVKRHQLQQLRMVPQLQQKQQRLHVRPSGSALQLLLQLNLLLKQLRHANAAPALLLLALPLLPARPQPAALQLQQRRQQQSTRLATETSALAAPRIRHFCWKQRCAS